MTQPSLAPHSPSPSALRGQRLGRLGLPGLPRAALAATMHAQPQPKCSRTETGPSHPSMLAHRSGAACHRQVRPRQHHPRVSCPQMPCRPGWSPGSSPCTFFADYSSEKPRAISRALLAARGPISPLALLPCAGTTKHSSGWTWIWSEQSRAAATSSRYTGADLIAALLISTRAAYPRMPSLRHVTEPSHGALVTAGRPDAVVQ